MWSGMIIIIIIIFLVYACCDEQSEIISDKLKTTAGLFFEWH